MPPDLPNDQELTLKKRARRRLVGAIALVLLMIIFLPQVLQDRALLAQHEPITITMPEAVTPAIPERSPKQNTLSAASNAGQIIEDDHSSEFIAPVTEPVTDKQAGVVPPKEAENKNQTEKTAAPTVENKAAVKTPEDRKPEEQKPVKSQELFTVQVGVYSDPENVKRLQEQLKQAGFSTYTEKVKTPKGDSLRLKAGSFNSRQNAETALTKIKAIGLSGIVVAHE